MNRPYRLTCWVIVLMLTPLSAGADSIYQLGAGDEIRIQVYGENDLSMTLRLDETGVFNYPYLGALTAEAV